jgi:hypothetical protein
MKNMKGLAENIKIKHYMGDLPGDRQHRLPSCQQGTSASWHPTNIFATSRTAR